MTASPARHGFSRLTYLMCVLVFVAALAVRLGYAARILVPFSADSDYYAMVGENLYNGRGLVADYAWNYFAGIPRHLPTPSNEYWMPGPSFAIAAAYGVAGGVSDRVAQLPSIVFDALMSGATALIGLLVFRRRDVALLAGGLCTVSFHLVAIAAYPDPFTMSGLFVNLGLLSLWAATRTTPATLRSSEATSLRTTSSYGAVAGLCAGFAYLSRTDGLLLAGAAGVVALDLAFRQRERRRAAFLALTFAVALAGVAAPWLVRQTHVFGHPGGASALRAAFASSFDDILRADTSVLTLSSYLGANPSAQLGYKTYVLLRELLVLAQLVGPALLIFWMPLRDRALRSDLLPWLAYMAFALVVPAYVFPHVTIEGSFAHLGTGFMPILCLLGAKAGIDLLSAPFSEDYEGWARARWVPLALAIAWFPGCWLGLYPKEAHNATYRRYPEAARQVKAQFAPQVALTDMAWGLWHAARVPCAQFPTDGADAALRVADAVGADYLIIMADAFQRFPALRGISGRRRFQYVARYPGTPADVLVFRIAPADAVTGGPRGSAGSGP